MKSSDSYGPMRLVVDLYIFSSGNESCWGW